MAEPQPEVPTQLNVECRHCGARGRLERVGEVIVKEHIEGEWHRGGIRYQTRVDVFICDACREPTIWRYVWSPELYDISDEQRIYPTPKDNSALPGKVRQRLDAATRVRKVEPGFYAVGIRRMLENRLQ